MVADKNIIRRLDATIWGLIFVAASIDLIATWAGRFLISWGSFIKPIVAVISLTAAGWFYRQIRPDAKLAGALIGTAQIVAFAAVAAPLSYIAASVAWPLQDATFAEWDRQIGFEWLSVLAVLNAHPLLHAVFAYAYASFSLQAMTVLMVLAHTSNQMRSRLFVLTFVAVTIIVIAVSAFMPAQGVWGSLGLSPADYSSITPVTQSQHLPVFTGIRSGTFRLLSADGAEGIITFPSLHAALGMLFILALWPVRFVRWIAFFLNLTMILATPVDGGHYFVDVFAGCGIAIAGWLIINRIQYSADETHG